MERMVLSGASKIFRTLPHVNQLKIDPVHRLQRVIFLPLDAGDLTKIWFNVNGNMLIKLEKI